MTMQNRTTPEEDNCEQENLKKDNSEHVQTEKGQF